MQCLWLDRGKLSVRKIPQPVPSSDEALVRLRLAGICRTDLELIKGYLPYQGVPGHEFVGEVVEAPGDPTWRKKRVVGEINASCRECTTCLAGRPSHCEQRSVLGIVNRDGVFAEYFCLPVCNLHEVPCSLPDEAAVFTEPLAAACQILEQVPIQPTDRVLIVGAGKLGQLIAQVLADTGCMLQVLARYPNQKKMLATRGILTLEPEQLCVSQADLVVEATGTPEGFFIARKAVRPRGTIVLKSTYRKETQMNLSALAVDEITLVGSRCGPFSKALELLANNRVDLDLLISTRYPLAQGLQAFEQAALPAMLKVLLDPSA